MRAADASGSGHHTRDVYYHYDVGDRQLYARFDSHSGVDRVVNSYDSLGRLTGSTISMYGQRRTLTYTLDRNYGDSALN